MTRRYGLILLPGEAEPGRATVRAWVEDPSTKDSGSVPLAETVLRDVPIEPADVVPFAIDVDDPPERSVVRVHVDMAGDGRVSPGDLLTTESVPIAALGADDADPGIVPVELV